MMNKEEARETIQTRLRAMSNDEYGRLSSSAYGNLEELLKNILPAASSFSALLYTANPKWREVPLVELERTYGHIAFDYAPLYADAPLPSGIYDIIFVPLFGFSPEGFRLGHGGGWYDKMLALQPRALKIGVGFKYGLIDFAVDSHDIPMNIVVTDQGVATVSVVDMPTE